MQYNDGFNVEPEVEMAVVSDIPPTYGGHQEFDLDVSEGNYDAQQSALPQVIKNFVLCLLRSIQEQNVYEIHSLYETSFNKLTERFYNKSPWPSVDYVVPLVGSSELDRIFLILYKELYYRHIYSKMTPTLEQRLESWQNYCNLFDVILDAEGPIHLELPNQWIWDIVDEFTYQFQSFCQFRSNLKQKSEDEIAILKKTDAWNITIALRYLHRLADKSGIRAILEKEKNGEAVSSGDGYNFGSSNLYKLLGYFSIISLCRVHCLVGDYRLALRTLDCIDLTKKGYFTRVTACHITVYYYLGFAYLMSRRYVDATKSFSNILLYIARTKHYQTRSYQFEQILKKNEQMYALLSMTLSLCPQRVDENVQSVLREKYGDKMFRMQKADEATFEELFNFACPKFITPSPPRYDEGHATFNEAYRLQLKLFLQEVRQQALLPTIRSYLKLYTTIETSKLANFLEMDVDTFISHLLCLKHKTRNLIWQGGPAHTGHIASSSEVDFYVEKDMVHIEDREETTAVRYEEFFIKHINKFEEIIQEVAAAPQSNE